MCDCFHLAFPNWHADSSRTGAGRRLRAPEPGTEDDSTCDEPSQFTERERPRPQGSSPVEEYPETEKYTDSDKECEAEHDPHQKSGSGKKTKKSGLGSMFEKRSTSKMSKLKEVHSPESGVIVKTAQDGCSEGLVYGGGGKEGIFIKEVVPESPASKSLKLKEGDQILSATVYFDNVSYEDAIQILEHAQAYKVKLCLKRKPDITESEPVLESDTIPEDDVYVPEMREQGKTRRRGDARISWPKFPSFGKGRKSRFTRSHSSSEADEQRKLELSPTTSDTESPIKSQDALKGKKKHKMKLSVLPKRGRISSSEEQDTDAPTTAPMISPECLESPSGETPQVYVTEDRKVVEDYQKLTEPLTEQHKVELITIDSTLKTEDLTMALAGQKSPSGNKSPDGKKKKKEKSELKMRIMGKDKANKKAKSSPKRLKTLGASIEIADQPENEKSDAILSFESQTHEDQLALDANTQISAKSPMEMSVPKVELGISDVALIRKSPQKGEEKAKKGKDSKTTFKLPKIGFTDIDDEETIPNINVNVEKGIAKIELLTTEGAEVKEDPYDRLSKSSLSRTKLPKREDIEIPGMEDMSRRTTAKGIKEPKAFFAGPYDDIQSETVQMSIDVDSVKEAVSKLPGFKLPKVDTSGVLIPEEITVIDANAQRISVKTPTKTKHDAHLSKFDVTASPEISKTTVKLPKISPADLTSEELLMVTHVKQSDKEVYKREHIIIPGKESAQDVALLQTQEADGIKSEYQSAATFKSKRAKITMPCFEIGKPDIKIPDVGIHLPKVDNVKGERKIFLQEEEISKTEHKIGGVVLDVKIPEIDGIEYIDDSVDGSPGKMDGGYGLTGFDVNLDAASPKADISFPYIRRDVEAEEHTFKLPKFGALTPDISVNVPDENKDIIIDGAEIKTLEREGKGGKFKIPDLGISMPKVKGPTIDVSLSKKDIDVTLPEAKAEVELPDIPEVTLGNVDVSIPEQKLDIKRPELEIKPWQVEGELDGQGSKFKKPKFGISMPKVKGPEFDLSWSKKVVDVTLPGAKAEVILPEAPEIDVNLGTVDVQKPDLEIKSLRAEGELDGHGGKFKMPKLGMSMPKVKGPEFHFGLTKKDGDVTLPEAIAEVELPEAPKISVDMKSPEFEGEIDGQGGKFKMPKLGMSMPKVKGPEFHFGLSKKDGDVTLPEAKAEVKVPEVELKGPSAEVEIKAPEVKVRAKGKEGSPLKFKMPSFKLPKFGVVTPNVSVEVPDMDKDVKIDGADIKIPDEGAAVHIAAPSIDIEGPSIDVKTTGAEQDGKGGKFKMPHLGFAMPKVKGPKMDVSLSKKDVDVKLPETKADVKLPEVDLGKVDVSIPEAKLEVTKPEMEMQTEGELDGQGEKFKMPKFGIKMPEIDFSSSKKDTDITLPGTKAEIKLPEGPKIDAGLGKAEVLIPEAKLEIRKPEVEIKPLQTDIELEGHKGKFQMPKFGVSMPKVKGPEFDLSWSKKDVDVTLPEAKAEVELPDTPNIAVDMKPPEFEGEMDGQGGKFKMPKFGISMPKVKGPEFDLSWSKKDVDVTLPEAKAEVELPDAPKIAVDMKPPECEADIDGQGGKFKMPKFGISMPKVKGPEFDLSWSKKDVDVTLPEAKAEVNLPDVELKEPSAKVEVKAPEIEAHLGSVKGSPSKFKLPTFKFPKFGAATPTVSAEVPDIDKEIKIDGGDMHISVPHTDVDVPEIKAEVHLPKVQVKKPSGGIVIEQQPGVEVDAKVKRPRFSLPRFSFSKPSVKSPEVDASLQDVNVAIPEGKVEVKGGEVDVKLPECEAEVEGSKFKLPKFGITMPKVKGPDIDLSWSKKDVDVTLPEAKAEVELPDTPKIAVDMKPPECEGEIDGQGGKFQMPKFGITMPKVKGPDFDLSWSKKDVDVTLPEAKAEVELPDAPKIAVDMKPPECEGEINGQGGKFKMPKFGITMPKVKGPEFDLSWSKKNVDVTLPEAKAEVELPDAPKIAVEMKPPECEADIDGQGGKFKMPKFGVSMPKVKGPEFDLSWSKKDVDVTLPEAKAEVELPDAPKIAVEMKPPEFEGEIDGQRGKFKMPKFGITMPKVKGPEFDLSWSKKDVDVTLPEAKAEVELPDAPKIAVDMKPPECEADIDGHGGKFKMPKFGILMPKVKGPEFDLSWSKKDVDVTLPEAKAEVELPDAPKIAVDMKPPECEADIDGQGGKFKMPKFGVSMPKVKGPEFDLSWSKKDVDVTLPEAKAEVNLPDVELKEPSAKVEVKAPEIEAHLGSVKGSPSKFKLPTFKFPKFGAATPTVSAEVPDIDKEIKIDGGDMHISVPHTDVDVPEIKAEVHLPKVQVKKPSGGIVIEQQPGVEVDAKVKRPRFSLPRFSFSKPSVKSPEVDASLQDVNVAIPEGKVEVKGGEVDVKLPECEAEVEGSKFKLPKFGITMPKVKGPDIDLSWSKKDVDVTLPEAKAEVELPDTPKIAVDMKPPECEGEIDGQGGKFQMPKFGITMPKVKGPDFDLSWSKKDVDVTLPEAKAEVELPDAPKIAVDMKPPECEGEINGQGGKFKMPKFGITMPKVKGPEFDLSWSKKNVDVTLPEAKAEVELPDAPKIAVEMKPPECEADIDGQGGKFKMPKFGVSMPKVKGPEFDLSWSKKDVDVTLPEAKAEVELPDAPKIAVEMKPPEFEGEIDGQRGKFKMPKFGITMPKVKGPEFDLSWSKKDVDVTLPEAKAEVELPDAPKIAVDMKPPECEADIDGHGGKFKMPKFGILMPKVKGPEFDLSWSKKDVDVTLPEAKAEVELPDAPKIAVDMKPPECEADIDGQGGKFKMPKFGVSMPKVKGPEFDLSWSKKDVDVTLPEAKAEVNLPDVELKEPSAKVEVKVPEIEAHLGSVKGSPSKFKLPTFKFPKFGAATPTVSAEVPDIDKEIKIDGGDMHISVPHTDVDVPEVKAEVHLPDVHVKKPSGSIVIEQQPGVEIDAKVKRPRFSLPRFSFSKPSVKSPEVDASLQDVNVTIPEGKLEVKGGEVDVKLPECEAEVEGSKFKLPKFGITMPKVTGPEIDLSVSKKDVTLPEAQAEIQLPNVELKEPKVEIKAPEIKVATKDTEGSPSKFKMPTFKLPKFGIATVEVPDMDKDIKIDGADINMPEEVLTVEMAAPSVDIEGPSIDIKTTGTEHERKGSKFKLPSLGFSGPQVKQPDIDLSVSKKDGDVTLPEAKVDVKLPDVGLKEPSAEVDIKAPKIKVAAKDKDGSPSKFKMPTFKLPKFGIITPSATVEMPDMDKDVKIDGADIKIPEEVLTVEIAAPSADIEGPSIDIKTTGTEHEGSKFKLPSFGFSGPQIKRPDIDFSLSKKDVDVTVPAVKAEVKLPDVEVKEPSAKVEIKAPGIDVKTSNVEGSPSKLKMPTFKLPKFGASVEVPDVDKDIKVDGADLKLPEAKVEVKLPDVDIEEPMIEGDAKLRKTSWTMPKFSFSKTSVKAPEADVNLDVPKVDVTLPEAKADVNLPDIDIKESSGISIEGAPATDLDAKLKKPRFSLPRFSFSKQGSKESKVDVSLPDVDVSLPEGNVEVKQPEVEFKPPEVDVELEGQESKFKLPKFGISMPKVKGPEIDLSLSKKDVDVTLPEAKAEVHLPDVKIKPPSATVEIKAPQIEVQTGNVEGSPSKYKMPTFTLPKFGAATPKVSVEVPDVDKDIKIDGAKVNVTAPSIDTEGLSVDVKAKGSELEGSGSKFKLPKFGISMPKVKGPEIDLSVSKKDVTLPEAQAEIQLPNIEVKEPKVEIKAPEIKVATKDTEGSPSKYKMPTFTLPKFGAATPKVSVEVPDVDKDIKIDGAKVNVTAPSIDTEGLSVDVKAKGSELEGSGSKFKLPKFGISMPKVKGPEIDLSVSKKDVTLPEAQAEIQLPNIEVKEPKVEIKAPEIKVAIKDKEGSPSKYKMPTFKLPKFGMGTPSATVEVPDMDKDIKIDGADIQFPEEVLAVHMAAPSVDIEGPSIDIKTTGTEHEEKGSKFKLPSLSFSGPQVKQPDIDLSLSKKDVDVTLPEAEVKLPDVEVKETEGAISVPDAPTVEVDTKMKRPGWTFPKFSFSRTGGKAPDVDVNIEAPKVDVTSPEVIVEVQGPSGAISMEEPPAAELDENLKKSKFSLPRFSFSKSSVKEPEELPRVDVSLPEGEVIVTQPEVKIKAPELEAEHDGQGSKFKLPKFGIALPKAKGPEEDLSASQKDAGITLPEVKAEVKLPEIKVKGSSASVEIKASETEGSQSKFKMPTLKMPKFGAATYDVTVEAPDAEKISETDGAKLKEDVTVSIKGPSIDIKTDVSKATDAETPKTEIDGAGLISPSKFKLPSFGDILKSIDVEFDVPKTEQNLETSKEVHETNEPSGKQVEEKETKQDTIKSPERTGWFRFPKFGMSSPTEPAKSAEKDESKDEKSPVWETAEEELSPTCSVQSSDAFADISSAMTSEHVGLSSSSPTKVTVKYSDPNVATGLGEMHGNIVTSTTRTELISVEPNLPEKITILSSSSEDTLRLESGKIHVITSNIQATPEAEHARLLSAVHIQSAGGLPLESGANEAASWTVEDSQGGKKTVFERHSVRQTSSERSESKETIVITKQITRRFDSSEPISGETASSIQRLKDSVHSEKMRFFDGVDE